MTFEPSVETKEIISFVDDVPTQTTERVEPMPKDPITTEVLQDQILQTVESILQRPITIGTFNISASTPTSAPLATLSPYNDLLRDSNVACKILRAFAFHADVRIRIQCNASPFIQGMCGASWFPLDSGRPEDEFCRESEWLTSITRGKYFFSTSQPALIDYSKGNTAIIECPFIHPNQAYDLTFNESYHCEPGTLVIQPIADFVAPASNASIKITVYAEFVNVNMSIPTTAGLKKSIGAYIADLSSLMEDEELSELKPELESIIKKFRLYRENRIVAQSGEMATATVSGIVNKGSQLATDSDSTPILGTIGKAANWLGEVGTSLLGVGLSKPQQLNSTTTYKNDPYRGMQNCDVPYDGNQMGLFARNEISTTSQPFRTKVDEMELTHIVSRPGLLSTVTIRESTNNNQIVYAIPISPTLCNNIIRYNDGRRLIAPTHLCAVASCFDYWKGTIKLHIDFVKTKFHNGRIALMFHPGQGPLGGTIKVGRAYAKIVNLAENDSVDFDIPFRSTQLMKQVYDNDKFIGDLRDLVTTVATGTFTMSVVNKLSSTSTVANYIQALVWISGASDFQFAAPRLSMIPPSLNYKSFDNDVESQSGELTEAVNGNNLGPDNSVQAETIKTLRTFELGMGESITNVRQLLKRYEAFSNVRVSPNLCLNPYYHSSTTSTTPFSHIDYFASMFRAFRGSMRIMSYFDDEGEMKGMAKTQLTHGLSNVAVKGDLHVEVSRKDLGPVKLQSLQLNPVLDHTIPFYSSFQFMTVHQRKNGQLPLRHMLRVEHADQGTHDLLSYRSFGDDASFGVLGALPPAIVLVK